MTGIIILAAGASSRMGQPKQQLMYEGKTLLQRSVEAALQVQNAHIIVVLGANYEIINESIQEQRVRIVYNPDWASGMSSSIIAGLQAFLDEDTIDDVLIMLCDQPYVDAGVLNKLINLKPAQKNYVIACKYGSSAGVPALFSRGYFDELLALNGQDGAKKVLLRHADKLLIHEFKKGSIDIDTPDDYQQLNKRQN